MEFLWFGKWRRPQGKSETPTANLGPQKDDHRCFVLDAGNFREVVIDGDDNVLVEFYNGLVKSVTIYLIRSWAMTGSPRPCAK